MSAVLIAEEAAARAVPLVAGVLGAGGVAVAVLPSKVRMRAELRRRWRTWALVAPVFLGAYFLGGGGTFVLAAGLGVVAAGEFARMAGLRRGDLGVLVAASVALPALAWAAPQVLDIRAAALLLIAAALVPVLDGDDRTGFTRTARTAFGLLWIPVALTGLVTLGNTGVVVGLAVALGDVGAWCGGTALGRRGPLARPLSPLSPNKTWAGVLGAAAATALPLLVLGAFAFPLWAAVLGGCVLGDLVESMVKRESGVKDAGSWLPGFGGLLDRIDSLLVALLLAMVMT
ncbi:MULTISPECIES: phosphatidate cytidylyltransferase [unclassified Streptomyces]|uniref:phosphatidate cytidylyltransferase n=1 Tax=unclassified Streptomyces TaxID=2593676 RepID=UPI00081AEE06|nr:MULTISPECIES: phosphatidate cytidylyltransferase [unclassified Streptomyces]MYQ86635.1 phosphatidate cytidylyltransferase [Streptomyces sp. SID4936]SCE28455.1 phosphatidate cytidylyltransferase [Streptomyces sp. DvalAA-43]